MPRFLCRKSYYSLSFEYTFEYADDTVYFAYSEPYTFTRLTNLIAEFSQKNAQLPSESQFFREEVLCKSISGVAIPLLTITSSINTPQRDRAEQSPSLLKDFLVAEDTGGLDRDDLAKYRSECKRQLVAAEKKKVLVVAARIHPGEACGSFVMEGFLRFLVSEDPAAVELRGKMVIKVVPMVNPDGVIVGNYRGCLCGQDLNRQFAEPSVQLHPGICAIKKLLRDLQADGWNIFGYIDMHGHSKKKCVFIHGPYYPLHCDQYVRVRILSKLLAERTQMFRYQACKYRQEPDKVNAARFVISREFCVMNSLTLESSFYGFINSERRTIEFCRAFYERMGQNCVQACAEYTRLLEEEYLHRLHRLLEKKKRRMLMIKARRRKKFKCVEVTLSRAKTANPSIQRRAGDAPAKTPTPAPPVSTFAAAVAVTAAPPQEPQNPNDPTERKVIRLEECFDNPGLYSDCPPPRTRRNLADICEMIKEDIKKEAADDNAPEEPSESSSSDCEMLTGEEEAKVIKDILSTMAGFSKGALRSGSRLKRGRRGGAAECSMGNRKGRRTVYTTPMKKEGTTASSGKAPAQWWNSAASCKRGPSDGTLIVSKITNMSRASGVHQPNSRTRRPDIVSPTSNCTVVFPDSEPSPDYTSICQHRPRCASRGTNHRAVSHLPSDSVSVSGIAAEYSSPSRRAPRSRGCRKDSLVVGPQRNYFNSHVPRDLPRGGSRGNDVGERSNSFHGALTVTSYNSQFQPRRQQSPNLHRRTMTAEGRAPMYAAQIVPVLKVPGTRAGGAWVNRSYVASERADSLRTPEGICVSKLQARPQRMRKAVEGKNMRLSHERRYTYTRKTLSDKKPHI